MFNRLSTIKKNKDMVKQYINYWKLYIHTNIHTAYSKLKQMYLITLVGIAWVQGRQTH